jgi:hypothetical protein
MSNIINPDQNYPDKADVSVISQMHDPIIQVTKIMQDGKGANRKSTNVINGGRGLDLDGILALQEHLLDTKLYPKGGPGLYEFDVTDKGSAAKSFWRVRLGGSGDDAPATGPTRTATTASGQPLGGAGLPAAPRAAAAQTFRTPAPLAPETEDLGNGLTYNNKFHLLTYPDGSVYKWTPDQPLPHLAAQAAANQAANAAPVGASMFAGPSVPAINPELAEIKAALAATQAALAQAKEESRERQRAQEQEVERQRHDRELAALREANDKQIAEMREMIKAITAKPAEDPRIAILEAERRERAIQDSQRDREMALRAETDRKFDALAAQLREMGSNKTEPMITLLTSIMQQQTQQAQENLRILKETGNAALATAQQSALTPERHMAMLREMRELSENNGSSIINEKMMGVFSNMLDMVTRFNQTQNPEAGTNWMEVIREVVDKGGTAVSKLAEVAARKATAQTAQANAEAVKAASTARVAEANVRRLPARPIATPAPKPGKPESERARDDLAAAMDRAEGPAKPAAVAAADSGAAPAPASTPAPVPAKRGRKAAAAPVPVANPIKDASVEELREAFGDAEDAAFFGPFFDKIEELRISYGEDPSQVAPDDVAQYILDARPFFVDALRTSGGKPPLAIEMLGHGKFEYLFERMLPEAEESFWKDAAAALSVKVAAERAGQPQE